MLTRPEKNKNLIKNNKYLLKQYKQQSQSPKPLIEPQGKHVTKLTRTQMLFIFFCIVAYFPSPCNERIDRKHLMDSDRDDGNHPPADPVDFKANNGTVNATPVFYKGQPARNVTNQLDRCTAKPYGVESGKKCNVDGKTYYLKDYAESKLPLYHDFHAIARGDRMLLAKFNAEFLKNNIGISVPNIEFFYEGDKIYYASQEVDGFEPAYSSFNFAIHVIKKVFQRTFLDKSIKLDFEDIFTAVITSRIDSNALSKHLVATTFISDITVNFNNWGTNGKGELVIIDMDISSPSVKDCLERVIDTYSRRETILLSVNNIIGMKKIYEDMLSKPLPMIDNSVDMSREDYESLLNIYIDACNDVVEYSSGLFDNHIASRKVNQRFVQSISWSRREHILKEEESKILASLKPLKF